MTRIGDAWDWNKSSEELGLGGGGSVSDSQSRVLSHSLPWTAGRYYDGFPFGLNTAGAALSLGTLYLNPIYVPEAVTVDRIGVYINTGQATGLVRLGLYESDSATGLPSVLLLDAGTVDATASSTGRELNIDEDLSGDTLYYTALEANVASIQTRAYTSSVSSLFSLGYSTLAQVSPDTPPQVLRTFGALPADVSGSLSYFGSAVGHRSVKLRVA